MKVPFSVGSFVPSRKDAFWQTLAVQLRLSLDYWRYL